MRHAWSEATSCLDRHMADWALSTNLYTWAQVKGGFFGWPITQAETDMIRSMSPGDLIVPKYSQAAAYGDEGGEQGQRAYCDSIGIDYDEALREYETTINGGAGAVPHVLRVVGLLDDDDRPEGTAWARVSIAAEPLAFPFSTQEFLRLRVIPPNVAAQFKATVSQGRHVQGLPQGAAADVLATGASSQRGEALRLYSLVRAGSPEEAAERLTAADRPPAQGDRAFLAMSAGLLGVFDVTEQGSLKSVNAAIPRTPSELLELFAEATRKANPTDHFAPANAVAACKELLELLEGVVEVLVVDNFGRWHDRYELLAQKVTQADELALRSEPGTPLKPPNLDDESTEADEATALGGLTIEAVRAELPEGMALPDEVLREAVTAIRAGKHLLLGGPPGTGKSTLAEAIARAVMGTSFDVTTATADWTTFDTIGGYLPDPKAGITFVPGVVLRALRSGAWLVIDELNRADIDKAFGTLFTLLNGSDSTATRRATLAYQDSAGKPITITWADRRRGADYTITANWRMLGTLNIADKASLFQLSFAFLRRFAVVDVPLPNREEYALLLRKFFEAVDASQRDDVANAAMQVAFGPRPIGPAILADIARFVAKGIAPIAGGSATYSDPVVAFMVGLRLMVVPQYEGAETSDGTKLVAGLRTVWSDRTDETWEPLRLALADVALK